MKGIYLTLEGKQEIEAEIAKLEQEIEEAVSLKDRIKAFDKINEIAVYNKILSYSTILPTEENWEDCLSNTEKDDCVYMCKINYEHGVIIKPPKKV